MNENPYNQAGCGKILTIVMAGVLIGIGLFLLIKSC